jgi:hypothetical protein
VPNDWKDKLSKLKRKLEPEKKQSDAKRKKDGAQRTQKRRSGDAPPKVDTATLKAKWARPEPAVGSSLGNPAKTHSDGLPPEPASGTGQAFNIGIDVGTSSLKVCVRPPGDRGEVYVVSIGQPEGPASALCPSTVTVKGGRIWFGQAAEDQARIAGGQAFRQLKVCMACEIGERPQVPTSSCTCMRADDGRCSAMFTVTNASDDLLASDLLMLLLGWAMGESRRHIPKNLTGEELPRVTYSISAPIDQIDAGSQLNGEYARVVFQAWRLSGAIQQGMELSEALKWIVRVQQVKLPSDEERLVELCPESAAIVAGYAMSPEMEEGQYAVIDIGAWTTEMSFFRFTQTGRQTTGRPARAFHAARSHRIAASQVDERCRAHVLELYGLGAEEAIGLAETIRHQREEQIFGEKPISLHGQTSDVCPRASALEFARDTIAEAIGRRFILTLGEAFANERFESMWKGKLRILFAGGGSLDDVLRSGVQHASFIADSKGVPEPSDLVGLPECDNYRRFLVAYGLAHGSARWPRDLMPSQVLPFKPSRRMKPTFEDLGFGA